MNFAGAFTFVSNEGTVGAVTGNGSGWEFEITGMDWESEPFEVKSRFPERSFDEKVHACSLKPSIVKFRNVRLLLRGYDGGVVKVWVHGSSVEASRMHKALINLLEAQ